MTEHETFDDMPLTKVLKEWTVSVESEDEIEVNDDRKRSRLATVVGIGDQPHRMILEVDENYEWISVSMYSPVNVPPARMADMSRILNRINMRLGIGRLGCHDDKDSNPVQYLALIDVEGGTLAAQQIASMVGAGFATFGPYGQLIAATALTRQPADALWANFIEEEGAEEAAKEKAEEDSCPSEL